ncbi:MAG: hypothetical protein HY892_20025 [Deltaproteobacteria bacterium]|nr:hypothetical protein [Deltaproteobacteria bacterium]
MFRRVRYLKCRGLLILLLLPSIFFTESGQAAVPRTLNFQGYLTTTAGSPIQGSLPMAFSLYAQETGGTPLWSETHPDVAVINGIYSVLLGSSIPIPLDFGAPYYLGIQVGADPEMTPRLPLTSVGYALRAEVAEQPLIQGFPISPALPAANQVLKFNGTNWAPSAVNLGTDTTGSIPVAQVAFLAPSQAPRSNLLNIPDNIGNVGLSTSIAIGTDGFPVISHYDVTNSAHKVAKCRDASCSAATLNTLDNTADVGKDTSIAIGADGFPVISYSDVTNSALKVAKCQDTSCSAAILNTLDNTADVGYQTSIAMGADSFPVISYYDNTNSALKVAKCQDPSCSAATFGTLDSLGVVGSQSSIAIGTDAFPVISYYDSTNSALKVAKCQDAICSAAILNTLDNTADVGRYTSIAIGADGFPVVSYYDFTNSALKVAKCRDVSCSVISAVILTTLDNTADAGLYTSIAIGADGFPIISYYDNTNSALKVAKCQDASCSVTTLNSLDDTGGAYTSIAIGADGCPVISYKASGALKVARCANAYCLNNWWRK